MFKKILLAVLLTSTFMLLKPPKALAAEGTVELRSTINESYRCFASFLQTKPNTYTISVSCRDLIYPVGPNLFYYDLWGTPSDGTEPILFGSLGSGRNVYESKKDLVSLFVTTEAKNNLRQPAGKIVMKGNIQKIEFLDNGSSQPTPTISEPNDNGQVKELTPTPLPSTKDRLITGFKRAGIISILALIGIIALIFIITRSK